MATSRVLCAAAGAAILGYALGAGAVAEVEPEPAEAAPAAAEPGQAAPQAEPGQAAPQAEPGQLAPAEDLPAETGRVARSAFTTGVADREPADELSTLSNDVDRVLYFTDLRGLGGRTVVHRWQYKGEVVAEVPFAVGGPRWRVHSSKTLDPTWLGEWTVSVVVDGEVIASEGFSYTAASAPAAAAD